MTDKEIKIIDRIVKENNGLTLAQITQKCGLPKTTAYRNLENLARDKILFKNNGNYYLGPVMLRWMNARENTQDIVRILNPYLQDIVAEINKTVHLVQLQGKDRAVYIQKLTHSGVIQMKSEVGEVMTLYSTAAGRAILAILSDEEICGYFNEMSELKPLTSKTVIDKKRLYAMIQDFRKLGYAYEVEQNEESLQCVGVAFEYGGFVLAISVVTTLLDDLEELHTIGRKLVEVKEQILSE